MYLQLFKDIKIYLQSLDFPESDLEIKVDERQVTISGEKISFSAREFDVLYYLAEHTKQVLTKEQLLQVAGSEDPQDEDNVVRCLIAGIRKKLRTYTGKEYIQTVRGVGYRFVIPEE